MRIIRYIIVITALQLLAHTTYAQVIVAGKNYTVEESIKNADQYESQNDYRMAANFLNSAAFYLWDVKKYNQAIELFTQSISLNEKINNIGAIASIESNLGMIYNDKREYEKALPRFEKALELRIKQKEKIPILKTRFNISVVLNNLQRFDESIKHLEEALKLASEVNDVDEMKTCYAGLSETYEKKGDRKTSMMYFDKYRALVEGVQRQNEAKIKSSLEKIQKNLELTETEKNNKEIQLAIKEKQLHDKLQLLRITDSTNKALEQQIRNTDIKLQTIEKEEAINELQRQQITNKLKLEQQIRLFIIVIIIVLLVFLLILYNTLRRIKGLNRLLTERNDEVLKQKQSLEDQNRVRTKLLSILSHDLRTPLSAVYLFLQILRSKTLSPEMVDKHLVKLEVSLNASFQMLDNMLYWTKNQINGIKYNPELINIVDIALSNMDFFSTNIENKSIKIQNNINKVVYIYADKEMVNIILRNLISNAIKFTPQNGEITISCKKDKNYAIISVKDTGAGISKEQQATLFTSQIISQAGTQKETGTGLGLLLVRDFVEINKGKISFESIENEGTTFNLSLPLATIQQLKQRAQ